MTVFDFGDGGCKLRGREGGVLYYDHWGDGHSSRVRAGFGCQVTLRVHAATVHCWNVFDSLLVFFLFPL